MIKYFFANKYLLKKNIFNNIIKTNFFKLNSKKILNHNILNKKFTTTETIKTNIEKNEEIINITKPTIYMASSNNIIFNLSTEEFFYETQNINQPILYLFQNDTNVVI